jgi:deoxyribonuclease V
MIDLFKLEAEQRKLAQKVMLTDDIPEIETIAGCDIAYTGNTMICVIVVMDYKTMKLREFQSSTGLPNFPYIPGFLSYREAPIIIETYHKLELDPDVLLIDGNGILHPRRMGLASTVGLSIDKPTIGVAKSLLLGSVVDGQVLVEGDALGLELPTKELAKPIYVSPGHRIGLKSSLDIVMKSIIEHKLPEPLHEAHKIANKMRRKMRDVE